MLFRNSHILGLSLLILISPLNPPASNTNLDFTNSAYSTKTRTWIAGHVFRRKSSFYLLLKDCYVNESGYSLTGVCVFFLQRVYVGNPPHVI